MYKRQVQVIRKRKDGNSYVVSSTDGNTYIRGRRLLKPISSPNVAPEQPATTTDTTLTNAPTSDNSKTRTSASASNSNPVKEEMPRRSPRNHVSTRAADVEIAARITAIYIQDIDDGGNIIHTCLLYTSPSPRD